MDSKEVISMAQENHNELNLYEEAKAALFSLIQQTVSIFIGFLLILLVTGGTPPGFVIALSFCLGTAFVSWSEQKRVTNLKTVDSSITPKEAETANIVTEERPNKNRIDHFGYPSKLSKLREPAQASADYLSRFIAVSHDVVAFQTNRVLSEAASEIQKLLKQLEKTNPTATDPEKIAYVNGATTPSFKRRVVSVLQAGGETAVEEFLDNPYVNIGKTIVKGWVEPE